MGKLFDDYVVEPLGNFVVVEREEVKAMSEGGLHMPFADKEKSLQAKVLAVGPGTVVNGGTFVPTTVKAGDTVLIDRIAGMELKDSGRKLLVVRETEIIAVVKPK